MRRQRLGPLAVAEKGGGRRQRMGSYFTPEVCVVPASQGHEAHLQVRQSLS